MRNNPKISTSDETDQKREARLVKPCPSDQLDSTILRHWGHKDVQFAVNESNIHQAQIYTSEGIAWPHVLPFSWIHFDMQDSVDFGGFSLPYLHLKHCTSEPDLIRMACSVKYQVIWIITQMNTAWEIKTGIAANENEFSQVSTR